MTGRYRFDDVHLDVQSFRLLKAGRVLPVEPKALNLLIFLVENRGRLIERRELIDAVWGDAFVTDHVLNRAIAQLRKLLADDVKEPRYIETVPTMGYRFIAQVEVEILEAADSARGSANRETVVEKTPDRPRGPVESSVPAGPKSPQGPAARGQVSIPRSRPRWPAAAILGFVLLVVTASIGVFWIEGRKAHGSVSDAFPIRSIAVLPLENLSEDSSQAYLADGMTDQLIADLGEIGSLRVISQTTALQYKNAHKSLPQIAKELNVDAVVEGSVVRSGDRIRIVAQLVDAPDDRQLWAHSYEGDLRDILGLQNQVAGAVAEQIRIELTPKEQTRLADTRPVNPRAYEALLKGYFVEKNTPESEQKALQYFRQAAELDPKFARAYVGIARAYNFLADYAGPGGAARSQMVPVGEATAASDAAVAKALELDPGLSEAYAQRAWTLLLFHWDFPGTERDFRHALELDPSASTAHQGYADYFVAMGRFEEGLQEMKRARDLDPLSPLIITDYCNDLQYARRYDDAIAQCSAALEIEPDYQWALEVMAGVYAMKHDYADAHKTAAKLRQCDPACMDMMDELDGAAAAAGAFDSWLKAQKMQPGALFLSRLYARLGREDQAFAWLEKAYEQRSNVQEMVFLGVDPRFDALRSDPRFDAFLRRAGLPPQPGSGFATANRLSKN